MERKIVLYIARRTVYALLTILILIVFLFVLIHIIAPTPDDIARIYAGNPHAPPSEIANIIKQYGLGLPVYEQILIFIKDIFTGNFGFDPIYKVPEIQLIGRFLPRTLQLVIPAVIISVILGIFSGAIAASERGKISDDVVKGVYLVTWAAPPFLTATALQIWIAYDLHLLPALHMVNPGLTAPPNITPFPILNALIVHNWIYFESLIHHMILPVVTLSLISFGIVTRLTRATMLDIMESDFFRLSLMKGLRRRKVIYTVALRNAAIPLVTLIALLFAYSIAGAVIIEDIFDYHGMGWFIVQSIYSLDYIAILDTTIIIAIAVIIANLVADLLYGLLDPRVRLE